MYKCTFCGKELDDIEAHFFDGVCMCEDCMDDHTRVCECCSERIWVQNAVMESDFILCDHCFTYHYLHCERCGRLIPECDAFCDEDSDASYCSACYHIITDRSAIHSYNYKPSPIFYGEGLLYLGIELEIDDGGEKNGNAADILKLTNGNGDRIYCKHDGSLNDGNTIR